jgi:hypothetical protein
MLNAEFTTGTVIYVPFYDNENLEGKTSFNIRILKDNELFLGLVDPPDLQEFGSGLYTISFTLSEAGLYAVCIDGVVAAFLSVVPKSSNLILRNLEDQALGSYFYNKETGVLTLYRQDGSVLRTYNVVDNNAQTSRELI